MSTAISLGAAQRARINIEDIAASLQKQDDELTALTVNPVLSSERLRQIYGTIKDTGDRITVLRRTGLATGRNGEILERLGGIQRELLEKIECADPRIVILTKCLRKHDKDILFLEASSVPQAGTPLKRMKLELMQIDAEITTLQRTLRSFSPSKISKRTIRSLEGIRQKGAQRVADVQAKLDEILNASCFSVEGRPHLRLVLPVQSLIGAFLGPKYRRLNTTCRDDGRIPNPLFRPIRNAFEIATLERDEACVSPFFALEGDEPKLMSHFFWIALDKPKKFEAPLALRKGAISPSDLKAAVYFSIASRLVTKFHEATRAIDFSNYGDDERESLQEQVKIDHWDTLVEKHSEFDSIEAGEQAQISMVEAVWIMRGLTNPRGERVLTHLDYEDTVGGFDRAAHTACYRLSKNHLLLLESQKDREAIAEFYVTTRTWLRNEDRILPQGLRDAYRTLKSKSLDAAKVLSFATGCAIHQNPDRGEETILNTEEEEEIVHIFEIAQELSHFENGHQTQFTGQAAASALAMAAAAPEHKQDDQDVGELED